MASIIDSNQRRFITCHQEGQDFVALADTLGVKLSTAYAIIARSSIEGRIEPNHSGGRTAAIDE